MEGRVMDVEGEDMDEVERAFAQRCLDAVVAALRRQGRPSLRRPSGGTCSYRGSGGTRCAIGHLIPDERYSSTMEGHGAGSSKVLDAFVPEELQTPAVVGFLVRLQACHDLCAGSGGGFPGRFERQVADLALEFGLTVVPLPLAQEG